MDPLATRLPCGFDQPSAKTSELKGEAAQPPFCITLGIDSVDVVSLGRGLSPSGEINSNEHTLLTHRTPLSHALADPQHDTSLGRTPAVPFFNALANVQEE